MVSLRFDSYCVVPDIGRFPTTNDQRQIHRIPGARAAHGLMPRPRAAMNRIMRNTRFTNGSNTGVGRAMEGKRDCRTLAHLGRAWPSIVKPDRTAQSAGWNCHTRM